MTVLVTLLCRVSKQSILIYFLLQPAPESWLKLEQATCTCQIVNTAAICLFATRIHYEQRLRNHLNDLFLPFIAGIRTSRKILIIWMACAIQSWCWIPTCFVLTWQCVDMILSMICRSYNHLMHGLIYTEDVMAVFSEGQQNRVTVTREIFAQRDINE